MAPPIEMIITKAPPLPPTELVLLGAIYPIFSFIVCMLIYFKTKKIDELSLNKGVKYFRRAFLFLGISFPIMFLLMSARMFIGTGFDEFRRGNFRGSIEGALGIIGSRYFLLVCSFYLLYSLLWEKFDTRKNWLYRFIEPLIFFISLLIVGIDLFIGNVFSTLILIVVLSHIATMSFSKYRKCKRKKRIPWYSLSLLLFSLIWATQFVTLFFRGFSLIFRLYSIISTPVILIIILYLVHKATRGV